MTIQTAFARFAGVSATVVGSPWCFAATVLAIGVWFAVGPAMGFSDTWQLLANTTTTLMTTLIVILIQNSQNRDTLEIKTMLREIVMDLPEVDTDQALRFKDGDDL